MGTGIPMTTIDSYAELPPYDDCSTSATLNPR